MVAGKELATGDADRGMPLMVVSNSRQIERRQVGFPLRTIAKWLGGMETRVPVGYEDEGGFHYGADLADWFFSI